jgi:hypothetical protein
MGLVQDLMAMGLPGSNDNGSYLKT